MLFDYLRFRLDRDDDAKAPLTLNDRHLIDQLGVYGIWLVRYADTLFDRQPYEPLTCSVLRALAVYVENPQPITKGWLHAVIQLLVYCQPDPYAPVDFDFRRALGALVRDFGATPEAGLLPEPAEKVDAES